MVLINYVLYYDINCWLNKQYLINIQICSYVWVVIDFFLALLWLLIMVVYTVFNICLKYVVIYFNFKIKLTRCVPITTIIYFIYYYYHIDYLCFRVSRKNGSSATTGLAVCRYIRCIKSRARDRKTRIAEKKTSHKIWVIITLL